MGQLSQLTNLQIAEKFGLSYSAVSLRVGVFKDLLGENTTLQNKFIRVKSPIKIWYPVFQLVNLVRQAFEL